MSVRQPDKDFDRWERDGGDVGPSQELDPFEFRSMMAEIGTTLAGILFVIVVLLLCVKVTGYG